MQRVHGCFHLSRCRPQVALRCRQVRRQIRDFSILVLQRIFGYFQLSRGRLQAVAQAGNLSFPFEQLVLRHFQLRRCGLQGRRRRLQLLLQTSNLRVTLLRQSVLRAFQLLRKRLRLRAGVLQVGLQCRDFGRALLQFTAERLQLDRLCLRQSLGVAQFSFDDRNARILVHDLLFRQFQFGRLGLRATLSTL